MAVKTVNLTHPETGEKREVRADQEDYYRSQGWTDVQSKK